MKVINYICLEMNIIKNIALLCIFFDILEINKFVVPSINPPLNIDYLYSTSTKKRRPDIKDIKALRSIEIETEFHL